MFDAGQAAGWPAVGHTPGSHAGGRAGIGADLRVGGAIGEVGPPEVQADAPSSLLYVPVGHEVVAVAPTGQYEPTGQPLQSDSSSLPKALEKLPAGQSVGATAPAGQNAPVLHSSHVVEFVWL